MATVPQTPAPTRSQMNNAGVNQHKRMAMGLPVDGKTIPGQPATGKKTPA